MRNRDFEDAQDIRRYLFLDKAVKELSAMKGVLHDLFGEVVRHDGPWPFYHTRQLQAYVEKNEWALMTEHPTLSLDALSALESEAKYRAGQLTKALFGKAGEALSETCGTDLKKDPRVFAKIEQDLKQLADIAEETPEGDRGKLAHSLRVARHSFRNMYNMESTLSDVGRRTLEALGVKAEIVDETDTSAAPSKRRKHLRIAEHWTALSNTEVRIMKMALLADYTAAKNGHPVKELTSVTFGNALVEASPVQMTFIRKDAQATRDLDNANRTLYQALIH
jgi:hypothetical protein